MKLENIGFYTLSDERAKTANKNTRLMRCELLLTSRCNFKCPYCRGVGGQDIELEKAKGIIKLWASNNLYAIRFSGGEPTVYPYLPELVSLAKESGIEKIAVSTNGSMPFVVYQNLLNCGVNDFSISLDACCAEDGDKMAGGVKGSFEKVIDNIKKLSALTYVTVGVVLTENNLDKINDIIVFAKDLGVSDIRVIPAAQNGSCLSQINVDEDILNQFPILKYRVQNLKDGRQVRGLTQSDSSHCGLVLDDIAACGDDHFACIIYMREGGKPIGKIGPNMREERYQWFLNHNTHQDPICSKNCLDICVDYNNKYLRNNNGE